MTYVLINNAPDGRHVSVHKTQALAHRALTRHLGRWVEFAVGEAFVSDWGNRLVVEERPAGHTAAREAALAKAFDAREMGVATKRQLALLGEPPAIEAELERMRDELARDPRVRIGKAVARDRESGR
jgi:hypothetical protein